MLKYCKNGSIKLFRIFLENIFFCAFVIEVLYDLFVTDVEEESTSEMRPFDALLQEVSFIV